MFSNLFGKKKSPKTTPKVIFKNTVCQAPRQISTQSGERTISSWEEVAAAIGTMLRDPEEFVVLTAGDASHGIRFIQATQLQSGGITLELALESPEGTRLLEKTCTPEECTAIFREFYNTTNVPSQEQYTPVEFYR